MKILCNPPFVMLIVFLQMIHPNVIDTSLLFARDFGRKFRLKFLAQAVLQYVLESRFIRHCPLLCFLINFEYNKNQCVLYFTLNSTKNLGEITFYLVKVHLSEAWVIETKHMIKKCTSKRSAALDQKL